MAHSDIHQYTCRSSDPTTFEEWLWTLNAVCAVEVSVKTPGLVLVYSTEPIQALLQAQSTLCQVQAERLVSPEDWANSWKQHWQVTPITPTLTVCPSWLSHSPASPDEVVLTLDPGAAFGTGTHESTRLMLTALDAYRRTHDYAQMAVLDVGTGSGILAIACALFGSQYVRGQDIDPSVLPIAEANTALNHLHTLDWTATPLPDLCLTQYDLVLANILAPVIVELMPDLSKRLLPNGLLLCSGIIHKARPSVEAAALAHGLQPKQAWQQGDWCAVAFSPVG